MYTLLIDNHDSYTYNLYQLIAGVNECEPLVVANDDPALRSLQLGRFDSIVVSPGPGRPQDSRDLGHVPELMERTRLPILGVCLGHQAIGYLAGARVTAAPQPRHGHLTTVTHGGDALFAGIPHEFTAVRYHSLCVEEPLPDELLPTAYSEDGVVMALRHRDLPRWGVQFHPESIASRYGFEILANFRELSAAAHSGATRAAKPPRAETVPAGNAAAAGARSELRIEVCELPVAVDTEAVFLDLYAASPDCFWLDSSRVEPGLSRFSFLGDASGPLSEVISCRTAGSTPVTTRTGGRRSTERDGMFEVLERRLRERHIPDSGLPFDLNGGYVGYFGYEMRADCGSQVRYQAQTPDAAWIFADRLIAVDHEEDRTYVLAVHTDDDASRRGAVDWVTETMKRLVDLGSSPLPTAREGTGLPADELEACLTRGREAYEADIEECLSELRRGESYEICLTNRARFPFTGDDAAYYLALRRANPAPYAAFLRIGGVSVHCSSPERFLRIDADRRAESKPIKGTAPRGDDPVSDARIAEELAADPKTRAENLMIVDLLRNDLGRICEIGSVQVDRYMAVESYATVHQLVSTISGRLRDSIGAVEAVRHCFPGGSMTGAPKLRTMEIIDRLESEARGVYSGTLGYFGLNGTADLNIVIRTAVRVGDETTVGAGGAIVLDSLPAAEFDEMLLKAAAPLRGLRSARLDAAGGGTGAP